MTASKTKKPALLETIGVPSAEWYERLAIAESALTGSSPTAPAGKSYTPASLIRGRQVKMARAALGMTVKQFATLVGLSPNTISHVERGYATLSPTTDGIKEALANLKAIEWLQDTGKSIGIVLHYRHLADALGKRNPKVRSNRRGRGGRRLKPVGGTLNSAEDIAEQEKRYGPDKRIRPPRGVPV